MRPMRRCAPGIGLVFVLALMLSGCVHVDRGVQLNTDGSGSYTLTLGFSDQVLSLGGGDFAKQLNTCGNTVQAAGGSYRQYEAAGYGNWVFTWPFRSVAALNQRIQDSNTFCNVSGSSSAGGLSASDTDFYKVTETSGFFATNFHATGQMSMVASVGSTDPATEQLLKDARESFAITFPGFVSAHNGGIVNGNTVTYTVHYNESTTIDATGGGINAAGVAVAGGGGLLVILAGILLFLQFRRRVPPDVDSVPAAAEPRIASVPSLTALANDEPTVPSTVPLDGQQETQS